MSFMTVFGVFRPLGIDFCIRDLLKIKAEICKA